MAVNINPTLKLNEIALHCQATRTDADTNLTFKHAEKQK